MVQQHSSMNFFFTLLIKIGIDEPPKFKKEFKKGTWALARI